MWPPANGRYPSVRQTAPYSPRRPAASTSSPRTRNAQASAHAAQASARASQAAAFDAELEARIAAEAKMRGCSRFEIRQAHGAAIAAQIRAELTAGDCPPMPFAGHCADMANRCDGR